MALERRLTPCSPPNQNSGGTGIASAWSATSNPAAARPATAVENSGSIRTDASAAAHAFGPTTARNAHVASSSARCPVPARSSADAKSEKSSSHKPSARTTASPRRPPKSSSWPITTSGAAGTRSTGLRSSSMGEAISIERDGNVGWLWLDNEARRNAMAMPLFEELPVAIGELDADADVRSIVIAAKGPAFTIGLDLKAMGGLLSGAAPNAKADSSNPAPSQATKRTRLFRNIKTLQASLSAVANTRVPVIAAVHGWCIGGGIDLITAADIRLASADAVFSVRETKVAIVADLGTLQRLPRIIGKGQTNELVFTGRDVSATEANAIGLVNSVASDRESLWDAAKAMAGEIASNSPLVVAGAKQVLRASEGRPVDDGLDFVAAWNSAFMESNDLVEAMMAFMQKRPAEFRGD